MRFTTGSGGGATNYDFSTWKVLINESPQRRSIHQRQVNKKGEYKKIGTSYVLDIEFFDMSDTDKSNLDTVFNEDFGELTAISSIDEVEVGDTYVLYQTDIYISNPLEILKWRRTTNRKQLNNWKTKMTIICSAKTTPTKV